MADYSNASGSYRALHTALLARRAVLQEEVTEGLRGIDRESGTNIADQVHDFKDDSLAGMLVDMRLADLHRDVQELRDIEAALLRMREGTYGVCVDCGGNIPQPRLEAYPPAKRCLACQEASERAHGIERYITPEA